METQDDGFHLTAVDVRRYDFGSAMRGYDRTRVDQFRAHIADELERLTKYCQEVETKARSFAEQLKVFRERDKAINEALISAQQLREEVKEIAARESELLKREAMAAAEKITEEARAQVTALMREIETLDRTRRAYISQLRILAERHIAECNALENAPAPVPGPPSAATPPKKG